MRQMEPRRVTIGEVDFAIFPFAALDATVVFGDLTKVVGPFVSAAVPILGGSVEDTVENIFSMNPEIVVDSLNKAFVTMDGEKLGFILRRLLIFYKKISYEYRDERGDAQQRILDADGLNDLFTGDLEGMIRLAIEVINLNFAGFFKNMLGRYGNVTGTIPMGEEVQNDSDILTLSSSQN